MSGFAFTGGAIGDKIYVSDNAGELADAAGTTTRLIGERVSASEIFVDIDMAGSDITAEFTQAAVVAAIATADATDEASAVTLANATKAKVNELIAALKTAGIVASA
jgi:hypothetical protein